MTTLDLADYHPDYRDLNAGAHRKAGIEIDTPTLTRHLAFWFVSEPSVDEVGTPILSLQQNGPVVDSYIKAIYSKLSVLPEFEANLHVQCDDAGPQQKSAVVAVFFSEACTFENGDFVTQPVSRSPLIRDLLSSDNRIISMKALWRELSVQVRADFHSEYFALTVFLTLGREPHSEATACNLASSLALLQEFGLAQPMRVTPQGVERCHTFIYHDIWHAFFSDVLGANGNPSTKIFADFRGLVIAGTGDCAEDESCLDVGSFKRRGGVGRQFDPAWAQNRLVPAIRPLMLCEPGIAMRRQEFTVSFMLRRRAIYMTALGPQPVTDLTRRRRPLHYVLLAHPANDWQLGSLLDRLHVMGTVRLAALMELGALRAAGANVKAVQSVADEARDALEAGNYDEARRRIERIKNLTSHRRYGRKLFVSGLQFRVERSRYYVARFRANLRFLRIGRIEGFEPYHQFVEGRLGNVYDYIDRLGHRHERALTAASNLLQDLQSAIAKLQNKQTAQFIEEIQSIQFKAEIALLAILLPYYAIATIHYTCEAAKTCSDIWMAPLFVSIGLLGPILAVLNFVAHVWRHRADGKRRFLRAAAFFTIVMVVFGTIFLVATTSGLGTAAKGEESSGPSGTAPIALPPPGR